MTEYTTMGFCRNPSSAGNIYRWKAVNGRDEAKLQIKKTKLLVIYMLNGTIRFLLGEFAGFTCQ